MQRTTGKDLTPQERKKLKSKEKKLSTRLKSTNKNIKEQKVVQAVENSKPEPQGKVKSQNGDLHKSEFGFSVISTSNKIPRSSDLHGRDYKRLLEKVEKRREKIETLKEKDAEAGKRLEEKFQWQAALRKAQGEKVKDDPNLLKRAAKRKEKIKEKKKKKWGDRVKTVDDQKQKRQQKRQANIDKRKGDKKDKKRKKLIKKGRILPGL